MVQDGIKLLLFSHMGEVAYQVSIRTKIGDLEWPWTAYNWNVIQLVHYYKRHYGDFPAYMDLLGEPTMLILIS